MNSQLFVTIIIANIISIVSCDDEVFRWDADIYPNLTSPKQAKFCTGFNRNPPSAICDPDQILPKNEALILDELITEERNQTKCICQPCPPNKLGLNIKVALVKFVKVLKNVSLDRSIEMFAERTRRKWRFGEECSNDVLIFFSALDDRMYISLGSRAKHVLSEEEIDKILKETRIHFTSGFYQQGLESMIASFQDLSQEYDPKSSKLSLGSIVLIVICVAIAVMVILFAIFWFCIKRDKKSKNSSFEFIGSWGRNKSKQRTQPKPRIAPIYTPVKTSESKGIDDSTLPMGAKQMV